MLKLIVVAWAAGAACYASRELGVWAVGHRDPREEVHTDVIAAAFWPLFGLISLYLAGRRLVRR